jgi:phytoene synthase
MLQHVRAELRPAFEALWAIDAAMGDVVARSTEPTLGAVKLAWWREQLERLDEAPPPAEPRLRAVANELLPRGITGAELAGIEPGWAALLQPDIDAETVAGRGAVLFRLGGRLLEAGDARLADAGALWALVAVGKRGVAELLEPARSFEAKLAGHRFARSVRVLTGLARLAARDVRHGAPFEPEGTAARATEMLRHRWSGIVSRG